MADTTDAPADAPALDQRATARKPWQFQPGNPGRKRGSRNTATLLEDALRKVEKARTPGSICSCTRSGFDACKSIDEHFVKRAFMSDIVLVALQKKRIPDLTHDTGTRPPVGIHIHYGHVTEARLQIAQPLSAEEANGH